MLVSILALPVFSVHSQESGGMSFFTEEEIGFLFNDENRPWNYGRLSFETMYLQEMGEMKNVLGYQSGLAFTIDHGIHHFFDPPVKRKTALLPGLRAEIIFSDYGEAPVSATTPLAGLIWLVPISKKVNGVIMFGAAGGMTFMKSQSSLFDWNNNSGVVHGYLGYEHFLSSIYFSVHGRFGYVLDQTYPLMQVGGSFAIGYRFDNKNLALKGK